MGEYHIKGKNKLEGCIRIGGGKNAVLPIIASSVLSGGKSTIYDCPNISDTLCSIEILESIGCQVKFSNNTLIIDSSTANRFDVPDHLVREMRSSIIFLGGLLGRFGECVISYPGGCVIGDRPIDLHLKGLRALGVTFVEENGFIHATAKKLTGAKIILDFPSVGATENLMLAAVFAEGETQIINAAKEPEIVDLQKFLNAMGADVWGAGTHTIIIRGVKELHGKDIEHTVVPDRIVAGTYLAAAAITGGSITLTNVNPKDIYPITSRLWDVGCGIYEEANAVTLESPKRLKATVLQTGPHPGFPTDMQPQLMAMLTVADGTSVLSETIFSGRNKHIGELRRLGAYIVSSKEGTMFAVSGIESLHGGVVQAEDLRGGAALILAGLAAEGKTVVRESKYIERGYDGIENDLVKLGADIKLV